MNGKPVRESARPILRRRTMTIDDRKYTARPPWLGPQWRREGASVQSEQEQDRDRQTQRQEHGVA